MHLDQISALTDAFSHEYLEHYAVLPLEVDGESLKVGTWRDSVDVRALDDLAYHFGLETEMVLLPESEVRAAIRRIYGTDGLSAQELIAEMEPSSGSTPISIEIALDDLRSQANEAPVGLKRNSV